MSTARNGALRRVVGVCRMTLVVAVMMSCGHSSERPPGEEPPPDAGPPDAVASTCTAGDTQCRADGLYTCDATGGFQLTEACARCDGEPSPHCDHRQCGDPGVTSACAGDAIQNCATGEMQSCGPGTCVAAGAEVVCVTKPGVSQCQGRQADGTPYVLACADANGVQGDQVCDRRSGTCVAAQFDCASLAATPDGEVSCDPVSGNYYTACVAGQPDALACSAGTRCSSDGSFNCYAPVTAGVSCASPAVCHGGLQCTQLGASAPSCVAPPGILACNSTDVLAVCADSNTGVACIKGAVWWWKNLPSWGGSCTSNHITLAEGGTCIPSFADCAQGLACERSIYDVAGTCRPPQPAAPAECTLTGEVSLGSSCVDEWHSCRDGNYYGISCVPQSIAGHVITLCTCTVNGVKSAPTFSGSAICNATSTEDLDAQARANCGWSVITTDLAQGL